MRRIIPFLLGCSIAIPITITKPITIAIANPIAMAVKPGGSKLFVAWYDRRNSSTNHMIETWGVIAELPVTGTNSFYGKNFRISTEAFPPVFAGDHPDFKATGMFDPAYPPTDREDGECPEFDDGEGAGFYSHPMGDYDMAASDQEFIYYVWRDGRDEAGSRHEANIRFVKIPWE